MTTASNTNNHFFINKFIPITTLILFGILVAITTIQGEGLIFEDRIMTAIAPIETSSPWLYRAFDSISPLGSGEVILIIVFAIAGILLIKKQFYLIMSLLFLNIGGILLNFILKLVLVRERPNAEHNIEVFNFDISIVSYSFPSGHTMRITILVLFLSYLTLFFLEKNLKSTILIIGLIIIALGVSLSRIVIGAHFPSDILAAVCVSVTWFIWGLRLMQSQFVLNYLKHFKIH